MNKLFAVLLLPFSAALVAIVLIGCATKPNELHQKPTEIKFVSSKSSKEIAECIADKWQNAPFMSLITGTLTSRTTPKGYTVIQNANGGLVADPEFFSDITDTPTGSETIFYTTHPNEVDYSYYQYTVKECQ
jgi:hypothetical protein